MKIGCAKPLAWISCAVTAVLLTACASPESAGLSSQGKLLQDAERYATELKQQNKLPGYRSTEHGSVIARSAGKGGSVSYPASVTVLAHKDGDNSTYRYDLTKETAESSWRLVKATRLDEHDRLIDQMFPK